MPSDFQRKMFAWWEEFWKEWVPLVTRKQPFDFCVNGDVLDGSHHRSTTQISQNIDDQVRVAESLLAPIVDRVLSKGGTYYHIRGTEAHVGQSGEFEERVARSLGAKPNSEGQYARNDLWKRVGDGKNSALVHLLHHVGTTSSSAHESSAVNAELAAEYAEAARWGREPPDYVVRSHRHRFISVRVPTARGYGESIVTPAWQGKTPWVFKIPGARISEPQVGGILIRSGDEEHFSRSFVKSFDRSATEV